MKAHITVYLPGLLSAFLNTDPDLTAPSLARLLSRATQRPGSKTPKEALQSFFTGLHSPIPSAALSGFAQGLIDRNNTHLWCFASAVECLVTHQTAYVLGNAQLGLEEDEKLALAKSLNQLVQQDGLHFMNSEGADWLCSLEKHTDIVMHDLFEVLSKNMYPKLPQGSDQIFWHRLLTEVQMLLQSNEVNKKRATKKPTISSLWFWGIGQLPQQISTQFDVVYSEDKVMQGLAKLANTPFRKLSLLEEIDYRAHRILIADSTFYQHFQYQSFEPWQVLLHFYEKNLFTPLLNALKKGKIQTLEFVCADGRCFDITKTRLKYIWRKIRPLALLQNSNKNKNLS